MATLTVMISPGYRLKDDFWDRIYLCKNHPLDDLQENGLFAKHVKIAEMCWRVSSLSILTCEVFGRLDGLAQHWLVGGGSLKDHEKC